MGLCQLRHRCTKPNNPRIASRFHTIGYHEHKSSAVAEMGDRLATTDMGRKVGVLCPFPLGELGPHNTMSPGPKPTSVPSGILIHPAVWPQYTSVTNRQTDRQNDGRPIA